MRDLVSFTKIKEFKGNEEEFLLWTNQFRALATLKIFEKALHPDFKDDEMLVQHDKTLNKNNAGDKKKKIEALATNNLGISYLSMAFTGDEMLCMIEEVKTPTFPGDVVCDLWKNLMDTFWPDDRIRVAQ